MEVTIANHPLIRHKLTLLRNAETPRAQFRELVDELAFFLTYEAMQSLETVEVEVASPVGLASGWQVSSPKIVFLPVLRAGLGMLAGSLRVIPDADVGFLGIRRDEHSLQPESYFNSWPDDLSERLVIFLDPMLATGGTLRYCIDQAFSRGARSVTCLSLVAAPEGVEAIRTMLAERWATKAISLYLVAMDSNLNESGYIVPGLGDAGDRLF